MPAKYLLKSIAVWWVKRSLYAQMLFIALAFALMVIASYWFVSDIERKHLQRDVKNAILNTEASITVDLKEPETTLAGFAETILGMIVRGDTDETVRGYVQYINSYMKGQKKRLLGALGFYGYFDVFGKKYFTEGADWISPEGFVVEERPWYVAAVEAKGDIGVTEPYINLRTGDDPIITFSRRIFGEDGEALGVVCLDIKLDKIRQHAVDTQFAENGYGFLLDRNMRLIAHPELSMLGMRLRNVRSYIAAYEDELRENGHIYEITTTDYRSIKSIVFIERLQNGWYMGVVTPRDEYYKSTRNMANILATLGTALAVILIIILGRISTEKDKADERMRIMFDAMPLGANIHNKNFDFFECNDVAVKMFGLSSKQEFREKFFELWPEYQPDGQLSSKKIAQFHEKVFTDGYCCFEWTYRNAKGELIPGECTLVRVKYNKEFIVAAYIRDLREIKEAMVKVREADERTQLMFDATPIGANFWDRDGNVIDCNQEVIRLFDMPNKQEYLKRFFDLSPEYQPDGRLSREKGTEFNKKAFEEGYYRFEWMHQKLNGEPIPCEVTLIRVKYKDGYIVVGYTRDLREQKAMLAEIHKENEKSRAMAHWYNSILNAIPLPISVTDADANWTFINTMVERIVGITLKDAIGKPCSNWGSVVCNTENCGIVCAKKGVNQTFFSDGDSSYQVDTAILKDLNGNTMGYIEVGHDITNLKILTKKQADAEAANLAKSAFLAKVSHEIRTPMNAIVGITEIQLQNEVLPVDTQEALGEIYNSGYLLLGIINDILDLSKIEAGKLELVPVNYDVPSLINDIVHLNLMRFDSKQIEFVLQVDENIPSTLLGDELRIKQILNNLLSNAFKYTDLGKVILMVNAERTGQEITTLIFRVSDTGQGMTAEQVSKLFDEYTRFNMEANRTTEGTGLGMSITRYLVQMMNGEISVESDPGKGSVFTVRLPQGTVAGSGVLGKEVTDNLRQFHLGRAAQMKKAPQIIREYMPYGRILVVDDVETNLYVAKGLMAPYGLSIETATSGFETIERIKNGGVYDIIFMDHFMPKMDGIEATKIIRGMGYTQPIVALTANALAGQAEIFLANGFDGFISKPIDIRQLNAMLNKLVRDKYPSETVETARRLRDGIDKYSVGSASRAFDKPELAKLFIRDAEKALAVLEAIHKNKYRRADDVQMYIVNVHAMKSALANIGEMEFSAIALKLEQAGRDGNTSVMIDETPAFLDLLRETIEKIRPQEDDGDDESIDKDTDTGRFLLEKLAALQAACAEYDKKAAKNALADLRQKTWPRPVRELLDTIAEHLLHSEFSDVAGLVDVYTNKNKNG